MNSTQEIIVQKNVPAEMRDGVTLVSDVYRPAEDGEYPILLTRQPYGKSLSIATSYMDTMKAAGQGYIVVIQDVRGRFGSEGEWSPYMHEFEDGYDSVEWAAKLPGSNGEVGMYGASYFGITQWQVAVMQPPSLRSMAPGITWGNYLNGAQFRGGVRELGLRFYWFEAVLAPDSFFRKYRDDQEKLTELLPALVYAIDRIPDEYDYDPEDPVPTVGGALLMPQVYRAGPRDQSPNEERSDVLVYTSEELTEDYTAIGIVYTTLYASSSATDTDFVARLVDVYPDGQTIRVTDGIIRASARESYPSPGVTEPTESSLIEPGEVYEYTIDLWATGITFGTGHRFRVEVTSSSFPCWDRNLNTGEDTKDSTGSEVARQQIFHDPGHPSSITLTVVES